MKNRGFTLVELVMVIVILGILSAIVLPKFLNFGKDARIAVVNTAAAIMRESARNAWLMCQQQVSTCNVHSSISRSNYIVDHLGVRHYLHYGYLDNGDSAGAWSNGIPTFIDAPNLQQVEVDNYSATSWQHTGAPDPSRCKVTYTQALRDRAESSIVTVTDGC